MILHGHVLDKLQEIESESVQCVVTSPPYWGLRDYGTATWEGGDADCEHIQKKLTHGGEAARPYQEEVKYQYKDVCKKCGAKRIDSQLGLEKTPEEFVENMVKVFREVKRVLKKDGTCWLNLGDSYAGSWGNAGGQNRGNGKQRAIVKGSVVKDQEQRNGTFVPPGARGFRDLGIKPKDLIGIPWRVAFALQSDGWYLRQDIIWAKPNPMPESVTDRCTKAHEYIFLLSKSQKYYYDAEAIKEDASAPEVTHKSSNKTNAQEKAFMGNAPTNLGRCGTSEDGKRNKRSVWTVTTKPFKEAHFAVFPPKIPELCIKAGTKEGDTVLDPFFGSGTTGWVAQRLGRKWIGIELNAEYIKIAEKRFIQHELF